MSDKPIFEIRRSDDSRFYAPHRDLIHAAIPILKAAAKTAVNLFEEEEVSNEETDRLVSALAEIQSAALSAKAPEDIVAEFFAHVDTLSPKLGSAFMENLCRSFLASWIGALRDCVKAPVLSEEEISGSLESICALSALPEKQRPMALMGLLSAGFLNRTYARIPGGTVRKEVTDGNGDNSNG